MTHRRWITVFIASFVPLGLWLLFWFVRIVVSGDFELNNPVFVFIIPTALYVGLQLWLAIRAFTT